jgi:hypothetical protein
MTIKSGNAGAGLRGTVTDCFCADARTRRSPFGELVNCWSLSEEVEHCAGFRKEPESGAAVVIPIQRGRREFQKYLYISGCQGLRGMLREIG